MMRTMTNVTGQMLVPVLVAKETGLLDRELYEPLPAMSASPRAKRGGAQRCA
jgi:Na+/H+-dicarboxylate symporter